MYNISRICLTTSNGGVQTLGKLRLNSRIKPRIYTAQQKFSTDNSKLIFI